MKVGDKVKECMEGMVGEIVEVKEVAGIKSYYVQFDEKEYGTLLVNPRCYYADELIIVKDRCTLCGSYLDMKSAYLGMCLRCYVARSAGDITGRLEYWLAHP